MRIDDRLAEAHTSIAGVKRYCDWDWTGAEAAYRRALELNINDPRAHRLYADYLSTMGRSEEALREINAAQELDPLSLVINMEMAWILYVARDFQGAAEQSWKTLAMEPRFAPAQNTLGLAYQQMGMIEEAIVELENASACSGEHPAAQAALAHALAVAGRRADAAKLLDRLQSTPRVCGIGSPSYKPHWAHRTRRSSAFTKHVRIARLGLCGSKSNRATTHCEKTPDSTVCCGGSGSNRFWVRLNGK